MSEAESRCPRCGGAFHCGFDDGEPCACSTVQLDTATRAELRRLYTGCLCLTCLRTIAASGPSKEVMR